MSYVEPENQVILGSMLSDDLDITEKHAMNRNKKQVTKPLDMRDMFKRKQKIVIKQKRLKKTLQILLH